MTPRQTAMVTYIEQTATAEALKRGLVVDHVRILSGYRNADNSFYCRCEVAGVEVTLEEMWLPTLDVQKMRQVVWRKDRLRDYRAKTVYLMQRGKEWVVRDLRSRTLRNRLQALEVLRTLSQ